VRYWYPKFVYEHKYHLGLYSTSEDLH
jgi:hypothetical protein